jgi:hypothetical protein
MTARISDPLAREPQIRQPVARLSTPFEVQEQNMTPRIPESPFTVISDTMPPRHPNDEDEEEDEDDNGDDKEDLEPPVVREPDEE